MNFEALEERNARVAADKAWETSRTRRGLIFLLTYGVAVTYLNYLGLEGAYWHALVPAVGYMFSTLTLTLFKTVWLQRIYRPLNSSSASEDL